MSSPSSLSSESSPSRSSSPPPPLRASAPPREPSFPPPSLPNLTRPSDVRTLLASWDFHPSRVLGQNFLIDRNILDILLAAADLSPADTILEPGPGLGVLTAPLLERAARVAAVEKDPRLAAWLRTRFASAPNFTLLEGDALDAPLADLLSPLPGGAAKLVSNLPYAIAARLLMDVVALPDRPALIAVTVQREVADRMSAAPGTPDYGLLSIALQRHYEVKTVKTISPTCFWPPPTIQSAISLLTLRPSPLGGPCDELALRHLLRHLFSQRRKSLARSLRPLTPSPLPLLESLSIPPSTRPETLPPDQFPALLRALPSLP